MRDPAVIANPRGRLEDQVAMLPTPTAGNFNDGESVESWKARRDREAAKGRNGNGIGTPLAIAVKLLPTPCATDAKGARNATSGRREDSEHHTGVTLLDAFWTGAPTAQPSDAGN